MSTKTTYVLISIDGMRPDGMMQADAPHLHALRQRGASTLQARTVMPSVTLPCHNSMLRGVDVPRHGITTNVFQPLARPVPSLLDMAHRHNKRVGFFYNWGELRDLSEPSSLDVGYFVNNTYQPQGDLDVTQAAINHQVQNPFDLLFVYLGHTDSMGHKYGWMSPEYLTAIGNASRCVDEVLQTVERSGCEATVLLLSDHGGHGQSHGTEMPEDMTIPWILSGKGIRVGHTLETPVRIFDTCPTLAALLGLPAAQEWEGKIITEAFAEPQE